MATLNAIYKISGDISSLQATMDKGVAATERLDRSLSGTISQVGMMARTVTSLAGAGAIGALVTQVIELGGELTDLASKTGLSTTELQKFRAVGNQVGVSIEQIAGAVNQLQNRLAGGDQSAISALKQLGLTWQQLKEQSPEEQFRTILDRLGQIPDHAQMVATGTDLMGRGFKDLIPIVKAGVDELDRVRTMSPEAVAGLDAIGDAWQGLKDTTLAAIGEIVGGLTSFERALGMLATSMGLNAEKMQNDWRLTVAIFEHDVDKFAAAIKAPAEFGKVAALSVKHSASELAEAERKIMADVEKGTRAIKESLREQGAELRKLADEDIKRVIDAYNAFADNLRRIQRETRNGVPSGLSELGSFPIDQIKRDWDEWGESVEHINTITAGLGKEFANLGDVGVKVFDPISAAAERAADAFERQQVQIFMLGDAFGQLGRQIGGSAGSIIRDIGNIVNAVGRAGDAAALIRQGGMMNTATGLLQGAGAVAQATGQGSRGARIAGGALTGAKIGMAFGPWGAAIGAAAGAITGWVRGMNQGRKAVKDFAESFGGFDALHKQLAVLGKEGEQLWMSLTQGTGNNNPQQAAEVIAKIQAGLADAPNKLNQMITAALTGGAALDQAMTPFIEDLIRTGQLTEENANLLLGLPAKGVPAFAEVEAAAEALGLDINALGENIKQLGFTESVEAIANHLDVLERAGADMDAVLTGSRDKLQKIVDDAQRMGRSLPESIRPFLQQMVDAGKLTDLFGNQLTDLDDLHFTKPLEKSVEDLIAKLHELVGVIRDDVGGALDGLGNRRINPSVGYMPGEGSGRTMPEVIENNTTVTLDGDVVAEHTARAALGY